MGSASVHKVVGGIVSQFALDLNKWALKAKGAADKKVREACFELTRRVILNTPVDQGRLRANWQASINTPASGIVDSFDKTGDSAISKAGASIKNASGNVFWLSNNLPYAVVAEFGLYKEGPKTVNGFSKKAPAGMVRISIDEVLRIISK